MSERILQCTDGGKHLNRACILRQVARERRADFRRVGTQERIAVHFIGKSGWQAGKACRAQVRYLRSALLESAVAGFQAQGKCAVGFGVFVPTTNLRVRSKRSELAQGIEHLLRGAFKKSSAANTEKRVAAEKQAVTMVGDMGAGVTRNMDCHEFEFGSRDPDPAGVVNVPVGARDARITRRDDLRVELRQDACDATDVIRVVVGEQYAAQPQASFLQYGQNRGGLSGINQHGVTCRCGHKPDIVVAQDADGV